MALIYIDDNDPWLTEYDACEKLFREIMEQLTLRNREPRTSQTFASLSANVRIRMKQYNRELLELKKKVDDACRLKHVTVEEAERRTRQLEQLQSKEVQLQKLYGAKVSDLVTSRASLLRSGTSAFADAGTTSWAADDDDNDDDDKPLDVQVTVDELMTHQQQALEEQEKGLEELAKVIARQKEIGHSISHEVDHQNEILDNLANHMDTTDESIVNKTRQMQNIHSKDRTCCYWAVIVILFIAIVTIALV